MSLDEFAEDPQFGKTEQIRVMGSAENAKLITVLHDLKQKGKIASVEIASPLICRKRQSRHDPAAVLMALRQSVELSPSLGGFHELTENDYRAYALAVEVAATAVSTKHTLVVSKKALGLLKGHPAWKALSFIQSLNPTYVAGLLAHMLDPRWYIDGCSPDRFSKVQGYLGLEPLTQRGVTLAAYPAWRHHRACNTTLRCWKDLAKEREVRETFALTGTVVIDRSYRLGIAAWDFPWRIWGKQIANNGDPVLADLRASQKFIEFVQLTWLSELYRDSAATPEQRASLFRPADFFKNKAEVEAYELHQVQIEAM